MVHYRIQCQWILVLNLVTACWLMIEDWFKIRHLTPNNRSKYAKISIGRNVHILTWQKYNYQRSKESVCVTWLVYIPSVCITWLVYILSVCITWLVYIPSVLHDWSAFHLFVLHDWFTFHLFVLHDWFTLIFLKMKMDRVKNGRWIIPFKKFGRLRVK